jgi:putative ABC transport system permease protein
MKRSGRRTRHATWQTAFAVAAIAASVALPVVLLSVGGGVFDHEVAELEDAGYEIVVAAPGDHGVGGVHPLAQAIDRIATVSAASPVLSVAIDAFGPHVGPLPVLAEGVEPAAFEATESPEERAILPTTLTLGDPSDLAHYANGTFAGPASDEAMLSGPFAQSLGVAQGATIELSGDTNRSEAVPFLVTGLVEAGVPSLGSTAAYALLLPLSDLQLLTDLGRSNGTSGTLVDAADSLDVALAGGAATDPSTVDRVAHEIQALVPFYSVSTLSEQVDQEESVESVLTGFYLGLSSVGIAIGLIFLAIVQARNVETERRSIGIRRAIGVPGRQVAATLIGRAMGIGGGGALLGVLFGWALVRGLAYDPNSAVQEAVGLAVFDPVELVALVLAFLLLSAAASLTAIRAALRLSLPEALR